MRNQTNQKVFKAVLLAGGASTLAMLSPAAAQAQQVDCVANPEAAECRTGDRIIVTGSRIARQDFEANSPFVTVPTELLEQSSSAALETALNRLPQFVPAQTPTAGGDIQPTATNTPGAATVSLRGIGSNRNLVLIDGRRGTPGNASGVIDISTIPPVAIERVEVISGGASATYGADAVAGVTNFILRRNFEGLELDARASITQEGDGFEYQLGGIMGADFADGRGNVSVAMSLNTREASFQRDRKWYRELWEDPTIAGTQFFIDRPGINLGFSNLPNPAVWNSIFAGANPAVPIAGTTFYTNTDGTVFTTSFGARGGVSRFNSGPTNGFPYLRTAAGTLTQNNTDLYLILPLTRYNLFARGNYEINDWLGVFATGLFSHVETYTRNEPGPIFAGWGATINPTRLSRNQLPSEVWAILDSRPDPNAPFTLTALMPDPRETFTDVMTYNLTAGLEGTIPGTNFTFETFVNHGISSTFAKQTGVYSLERLRTVLDSGNFGAGFRQQGNPTQGGFGASTATCTSGLNFFLPPPGGFSEDCLEAIRADLKNRVEMRQTIVEANISGGLFNLPAGEVGMAIGASYREQDFEFTNDTLTTQGRSFMDQALGIYPSGNTSGYIDTHEIYGELLIPLIHNTPLIQQFNLEVGGRISDYSTTGVSYTYKILGDWEVTDWLRLRGGYNRAERAPNIGELFLDPQQTFGVNNVGDLCSKNNPLPFSANNANGATGAAVEAVCRLLMDATGDPTAKDFFYLQNAQGVYVNGAGSTATFGFAFPTTSGNPNLVPETADTWTAGMVVTSPFNSAALSRLRLSVDYFHIKVNDAIGVQTVGTAFRQCVDPSLNPLVLTNPAAAAASPFCRNVPRNTQNGGLGNVTTTYVNNGRFVVEGIDAQLDWGIDVGPGTLNLNVLFNYLIDFKSADLPVLPLVDYVGTFGAGQNGLNPGPFEYRVLTNVGYRIGPANIGIQWQHLSSIEDAAEAQFGPNQITGAPAYHLFHLNTSYQLNDAVSLRFGVENIFNKAPPLQGRNLANTSPATNGNLPGGSFNTLFYDTNGRRFYLGANLRF